MRSLACLIGMALSQIMGAAALPSQARLHDKEMAPLAVEGWFTMMGTWDQDGRPIVMDLSYTHKNNPDTFRLHLRSPHRAKLRQGDSNEIKDFGATVTQDSDGKGRRQWFVHAPLGQCCGVPHDTEFWIITPGAKDLPGKLEYNAPGSPKLRLWEEEGRIRWEVTGAWQVKLEATVNDGESWTLLGAGNSGQCDLKPLLPREPVLRITAFRGLRCFAEVFVPGQGLLPEARPYLQPTYMVGTARDQGAMSGWPYFNFSPLIDPPKGYQGRVKVHLNFKRLPFDVEKLFPGKYIQKVFQAEWLAPSAGTHPAFLMQANMLCDPKRWKGGWLHRIRPDGKGGWIKEAALLEVGKADEPRNNPGNANNIFVGGNITYEDWVNKYQREGLEVNFSYYFVLVGD